MYGCYNPYFVYGILDKNNSRSLIFDDDVIEELELEIYGKDVVRLHLGDAVYGVAIELGEKATEEQVETVGKALDYLKAKYTETDGLCVEYCLAIKAYDWGIEHELYQEISDSDSE